MRVAGEPVAVHLLAEAVELGFGQPAFQVGAGVDAGALWPWHIDAVAAVAFALGVPVVVEACAQHRSQRGKGADVAAQVAAVSGVQRLARTTMAMAFQRM